MIRWFWWARLTARNLLRHKLRTALTLAGLIVATVAFGLLRTVVETWYAGAEATSARRLVTRNAISLVFPLPISHLYRIRQVRGVETVSYANWFAGVYIDAKNFFPQFAVQPQSYFSLYPDFVLSTEALESLFRDRRGAVAGRRVVEQYGWKVGDVVPLRGTLYPGEWSFVLKGVYHGAEPNVDETNLFFHWDYLNESLRAAGSARADHVGIFIVGIERAEEAARVSKEIDALFKNSHAETLTETEKAFQLAFVAMTEAILWVVHAVSLIVLVIILAVLANTMAMAVRERQREYATLMAVGFRPGQVITLILAESCLLALTGGALGVLLTFPSADVFGQQVGTLFPVFRVSSTTVFLSLGATILVGLLAGLVATLRVGSVPIAASLREAG